MKTSVFIPCTQKHAHYIPGVVRSYCQGTVKPDEIVVFISGDRDYELFRNTHYEKHVKEKYLAGEARQKARDLCRGDIILYHDADDLPHPQRVEVVKYWFGHTDAAHMTHSYAFLGELPKWANRGTHHTSATMPKKIIPANVPVLGFGAIREMYFPDGQIGECSRTSSWGPLESIQHAGACCIRREVLDAVRWKRNDELVLAKANLSKAEDFEFCMECAFKLKSSMLNAVLYQYRV